MTTILLILLFIFIGLMILVMFLLLKRAVITINQQAKEYFVDKLQVYDELIEEKEKKLKGLSEELENKQKAIEEQIEIPKVSTDVYLYDMKNINYQDVEIFQKMKNIDEKFDINTKELLKKFISEKFSEENISIYEKLIEERSSISQDLVYELVLKNTKEQEQIIREMLKDGNVILDDFLKKNKKFNIIKFISYFDKIIAKLDPFIYVYVGNTNENYDNVHSYIRTKVDESIYKGFSIIYKGRLYDYSLK